MEEDRKKLFMKKLENKQYKADGKLMLRIGDPIYLQGYSDGLQYAIDLFSYMFLDMEG